MSAWRQKRTLEYVRAMSALPPKADIGTQPWNVRFVPEADIPRCGRNWRYSITSSARASTAGGMVRPSTFAVFRLTTSSYLLGRVHRYLGRVLVVQDAMNVVLRALEKIDDVRSVRDQPAGG